MISFPGIGIKLNVSKIACNIFGIDVYWYGVIIVSAIIIALLLCKKDNRKYGITYNQISDLSLYVFPVAIVYARLYYCAFHAREYSNILEVIDIRNGGLAIYGGIIGGIVTTYIYCKAKKVNFLDMLDYIVPYLALAQSIGRWGNFINIEAYGTETTMPWRMGIFEGEVYKEVHPTFLYESISTFIIFIFLYRIRNKRKYSGQLIYLYLALYGFARTIIEGIRVDSLMIGDVRISQLLSIMICIIFGGIIIYKKYFKIKGKNVKRNEQKC